MRFLIATVVLAALVATVTCSPARTRRSYQQYYSAASSPVYGVSSSLGGSGTLSQESLYRSPSSYYPSTQTYSSYASPSYTTSYASVPQYNVQASPVYSQVSAPALYDAEHSEHASSSSHYRLRAPATVTYTQPSAQYVQPSTQYLQPSAQYVQPSVQYVQPSTQYVQPSAQYVQPSTQYVQSSAQYVQPSAQYVQPSWQQGTWSAGNNVPNTWTANDPWC